jgi:flagellar biosynthesis/type III secretory pathway chaperone
MTAAQNRTITDILTSQINSLESLSKVLEEESAALRERDADALLRLAASKEQQLASLRQLEAERRTAAAAMTAVQRAQLADLASDCRTRNAANGALAEAQRRSVTRLLRLLRGDSGSTAYDVDGKQKTHADSRMTLATV